MRNLMLLAVLLLSSSLLHAQRNYAVGVVDSRNGKPIVGAAITILSNGSISKTSESGNVVMFISPEDSLLITAKGYKDRKLLMKGQFVALSIILDPLPVREKTAPRPKKKKTVKVTGKNS
ncbi:MAG: hypothetical protein ACKOU7_14085 [Ferruginibacter sp.]